MRRSRFRSSAPGELGRIVGTERSLLRSVAAFLYLVSIDMPLLRSAPRQTEVCRTSLNLLQLDSEMFAERCLPFVVVPELAFLSLAVRRDY